MAGFVSVLLCGAVSDIRTLEIANWISIVLVLAYLPAALNADLIFSQIAVHYGVALVVFMGSIALYALKLFGGGDVKFLAAVALWVPWHDLGSFLFLVALLGGLLAIVIWITAKLPSLAMVRRKLTWIGTDHLHRQSIPYGVAIAGAGLMVIIKNGGHLSG
ncbi:MAG: prepilin peptidase [Rhodospirillales bacterium]|nr:prepilin peptidase [Rhodospirillales bacterium]